MKVNIIGPYPPPYGGISVHVKRMKKYLISKGVEVEVFKDNKMTFFKIPFLKGDIIHLHSISIKKRIAIGLYAVLGKKIVLTIHGESLHDQLEQSNWITKKLLLFSLKKISRIICVNSKTLKELSDLGIGFNKLSLLTAYINPIEDKNDFTDIPEPVWDFINASKFLISANGWIRFYKNEDLYGIDMLIELMKRLIEEAYDVSMLIAVLGTDMQNQNERLYYKQLRMKIIGCNLEKNIFIFESKNTEFYPILKKSNLFIRPTNTDGYGVSTAEALYYNVPSIASDVCKRPDGTLLFKSRDIKDLYNKTVHVINNYDSYREKTKIIKHTNNGEKLLDIYKQLIFY